MVALGKIGFDAFLNCLKRQRVLQSKAGYRFAHEAHYVMPNGVVLLASYHPSNQNTATGKLTAAMLESVFRTAKKLLPTAPESLDSRQASRPLNTILISEVL